MLVSRNYYIIKAFIAEYKLETILKETLAEMHLHKPFSFPGAFAIL